MDKPEKNTLTKAELAHVLSERVGFPKHQSARMVEAFFDVLQELLLQGEDVKLTNFGQFHVRTKVSRPGRNPRTGEEVTIAPRRVVTFHPSLKLKMALRSTP